MSLGLPGHLAPRAVSAGIARAAHVIAAVCLFAALVATLVQQAVAPTDLLWPSLIPLAGMALLLYAVERRPTALNAGAYLLLGAALSYLFALIGLLQVPVLTASNAWVFTMLKVALVMVGAVGSRVVGGVVPPLAGYVLGEVAIGIGAIETGKPVVLDVTAALAALLVVVVSAVTAMTRRGARRLQPALHRAVRDERIAELRQAAETRAAALLHDTVLSDLAAISAAPRGPLSPALASRLRRDLETIIGQDWSDAAAASELPNPGEWAASGLAQAIEDARALGLDVTVSGDPASVATLARPVDEALGLAVRQLLVNVHKHAGVRAAEVVVYAGGGTLSVMVIDGGRGFDQAAVQRDRFGLRHSVRSRIETVGGRVQVWSAPGRGTSVLVQVPDGSPAAVPGVPESEDAR
ncbi:sensor histidine kinase [Naasia sp. SYSU D00057]|uniref:sensor histidine kinase n=1 Tax=Naasia sp. SYSU D00057 TaxID=2817380 RepID=UPI001B314552|nr:ATP-binding protein [Naasia sp. SYSU D00057]